MDHKTQTDATEGAVLVELCDVEYAYPSAADAPALRRTSLTVKAGEIVKISGRNGTGKTTLLKVMAKKLMPTGGARSEKPGLRVVYLDQNAAEFIGEALTVHEQMIIGLGASLRPLTYSRKGALKKKASETLSHYRVGLEDKLDRFTSELSGGQRQIIALISVLLSNAELLVLDEFTAAMDPISTRISNDLIQRAVRESQIAVVFVSHSLQDALVAGKEIKLE